MRPLQVLCPACGEWVDAVGINDDWECSCGANLPEAVSMRGGRLDELAFAMQLQPAGHG